MTENIIDTSPDKRYRLRLAQETDPANPRTDYDHLTNVITPHGQRYIDIDADGGPLQDAWDYYYRQQDYDDDKAVELLTRHARMIHGVATVLDNRPYDGAWGLWYVMPDKAAESEWEPERIIEADIAEYRAWAEGNVYGYIVEKRVEWQVKEGSEPADDEDYDDEMETWEQVDSCWGYIGYEHAEEAAREAFADYGHLTDVHFEVDGETVEGGRPGETWHAVYTIPKDFNKPDLTEEQAERFGAPRFERGAS